MAVIFAERGQISCRIGTVIRMPSGGAKPAGATSSCIRTAANCGENYTTKYRKNLIVPLLHPQTLHRISHGCFD